MSNNLININILGNTVTSMKTRSNMAKIPDNLHIFRNFRKSSHQYENLCQICQIIYIGQIWPKFWTTYIFSEMR